MIYMGVDRDQQQAYLNRAVPMSITHPGVARCLVMDVPRVSSKNLTTGLETDQPDEQRPKMLERTQAHWRPSLQLK